MRDAGSQRVRISLAKRQFRANLENKYSFRAWRIRQIDSPKKVFLKASIRHTFSVEFVRLSDSSERISKTESVFELGVSAK